MRNRHAIWTSCCLLGLCASAICLGGCAKKPSARTCVDADAKASALEYVRSDLFKWFAQQADQVDPTKVSLESVRVIATDEATKATTCSAILVAGGTELQVPVELGWSPGGREGDEYSARIWLAGAAP